MSEQMGITNKKENFSEWFSEVCFKCNLVDLRYNVQGFVVHRPWAMKIIKKMYSLFEQELEKTGHEPVLFPVVIPEKNFIKESEHVEEFAPEVFWITHAGDKKLEERLALRPTSETAMYQMYSLWIRSYKDLPFKRYQSVSVFRNETTTRPFLRGREFLWIEGHDAFATEKEMMDQVNEDMVNTRKVIEDHLGLPIIFFKRPQWDKFAGAVDTYAADVLMPDGKANQISSTHNLGTNFSRPFDVSFVDSNGQKKYAWQTCYGPGIWRIMAGLIAVYGDDKGLVLPFEIAPIQVIIIPIKDSVLNKCEKIKKELEKNCIRAKIDKRDETPGWKFNDWEMKGVPIRIEIGPKEVKEKTLTLARRDNEKKYNIKDKDLIKILKKFDKEILNNLRNKASIFLRNHIFNAKSRKEVLDIIKKGGYARINFCGRESCAEDMQNVTQGGKVRGVRVDKKELATEKCAWCGGLGKEVVYVAKQY